jgi:hypothetical protein
MKKITTYIVLAALLLVAPGTKMLAQTAVGTIPGQVSASPNGAATYTIPIELPAGINGMQPNLSLNYNSQGGDGPFGMGWNLSGLPTINKSIKSIFSDNAICGIENSTSNAYALNGQRLFVKDFVQLNLFIG